VKVVNILPFPQFVKDSFSSLLAGFGGPKDKARSMKPILDLLTQHDLEALYRADWISKKVVDIPAFDACRAWRDWECEEDKAEDLKQSEKDLGIQGKLFQCLIKSRLYGGAVMLMGIKNQKFEDELDIESVGKDDLAFVHVISRWHIAAGTLIRDITSPWYGQPSYYMRSNTPVAPVVELNPPLEESGLGYKPGSTIFIHPSRVIRLVGSEYPDIENSPDAWGDSSLQPIHDAIRDAGLVTSSIAAMIAEAKLDVVRIPGLTNSLATDEGTQMIYNRFANAMAAKSVIHTLLLDKDEEWERKQLSFSGMDKVMQMYLMIVCGAADIPATRLLGKSPDGMNASGDSDSRNYYDRLGADQTVRLGPAMSPLDEVLIRHTFGSRDKSITYEWNSLWQESDDVKAGTALKKSQSFQIDVNSAIMDPEVLKRGREAQLIADDVYPGLDIAIAETGDKDHADIVPEEPQPDDDPNHQKALELIAAKGKVSAAGKKGPVKK